MRIGVEASWRPVDERSFDVALTDNGRTVTARIFVDERGAPLDFETTDRFYSDPDDPGKVTRCRWTTPMDGMAEHADRMLPTRGRAVWRMPDGDLPYADFAFDPKLIAFNVPPG